MQVRGSCLLRTLELVSDLKITSFLSLAAALLSIPGFVERLCKLATRKVSESTGTASFLQELEEWYTWLDNALVLDALMRVANEESEHSQGTCDGSPERWGTFLWIPGAILDLFSKEDKLKFVQSRIFPQGILGHDW